LLWPTLSQIFRNKAGILKKGVPCFTRLDTPLMHRAAKTKHVPVSIAYELVPTNLCGNHQQQNAGLAFHCLTTLWFDADRVRQWLTHINHPWRTQWLAENILLDGAHNEEWVRAFAQYVDSIRHTFNKVITVFWSTKTREEYPEFFGQLIPGDINYLVLPAIEHRAVDPATYKDHLWFDTTIWPRLSSIWDQLPRNDKNTLILVYGSLYLAGEFLEKYQEYIIDSKSLLEKTQ
jgi:dihydrofolate synthase/folylpolyglutamate synthase